MVGRNGWNWVDRHGDEAATMAELLHGLVAYFNDRYAWTADHLIPVCWARHGALVEEITTLMWSRWSAFESPDATAEAARSWHTYYLPGFLARVNTWLGSAGPECRAGHHEPSAIPERRTAAAPPRLSVVPLRSPDERLGPASPSRSYTEISGATRYH
jgi:hypothetical protein